MLRRRPWLIVVLGLCGILGVLVAVGASYWKYANFVPEYPRPVVAMPVPNAYDDYVHAGQMCVAAGGATVAPASPGSVPGLLIPNPAAPGSAPAPPDATVPGAPGAPSTLPVPAQGTEREGYERDVPLPQVRAVVARNRAALVRLRQGFGKSFRNPPGISDMVAIAEPAQYRALARVLVTEGTLAEREGRLGDAARSYLDCLRLGVDIPRGGDFLHGLASIAVQAIGLKALEGVVDRLDSPTALAAARELIRLDAHAPGAAEALQFEKQHGTESLVQIFRQGLDWRQFAPSAGAAGPPPTAQDALQVVQFVFALKRPMVERFRAYMDALIADSRKPYYTPSSLPAIPTDPLSGMMLPTLSAIKWRWSQHDTYWRILELRLAVRAYQSDHGAPPPTTEALVPAYLSAVPRDPFADKPLVYRVQGNHALVYSRGPDGKDDGGMDLGWQAQPGMKGDIVSMGGRQSR